VSYRTLFIALAGLVVLLGIALVLVLANDPSRSPAMPASAPAQMPQAKPRLSAPLSAAQVKAHAKNAPIIWLGPAKPGWQLRANKAFVGAIQLAYFDPAAARHIDRNNPGYTVLITSGRLSAAHVAQTLSSIKRAGGKPVALANGLTAYLPSQPPTTPVPIPVTGANRLVGQVISAAPLKPQQLLVLVRQLQVLRG
jgi:hypothetical protein